MTKWIGCAGGSLLSAGVGRALDPHGATSLISIIMIVVGAGFLGLILGCIAEGVES